MHNISNKILIVVLISCIIALIVVGIQHFSPEKKNRDELRARREQLQAEKDATHQEIANINRNIEHFNASPNLVERLARENQRIAENEVLFILEDPKTTK